MHAMAIRQLLRSTVRDMAIGGRRYRAIAGFADPIFRSHCTEKVRTAIGTIRIDPTQKAQRLLAYAFEPIFAHYSRSDLGLHLLKGPPHGGVFVDVGANLGLYSMLAATAGFQTVCVEPDPDNFAFLARNSAFFHQCSPIAASSGPGLVPFFKSADDEAGNSMEGGTGAFKCTVACGSLAHTLMDLGVAPEQVDCIKIDVEGSEAHAVRGLIPFLADSRPAVWCEMRGDTGRRGSGSYREVCQLLGDIGYQTTLPDDLDARPRVFDAIFTARN